MHTRVIHPITTTDFCPEVVAGFQAAARPGHEVSSQFVDTGPPSLECYYDEAFAVPGIIKQAVQAAADGCDAVIINCAADPGLYAVREVLSIPVVGPTQAAMHMASVVAHSFSVIAVQEETGHMFSHLAGMYGLGGKLASVRPLGLTVMDLSSVDDQLVSAFADAIELAVREDGAHAIVMGCTALAGMLEPLGNKLAAAGVNVPVIDPVGVAVKTAESMHDLGLVASERSFPVPAIRPMVGYE